METKNLRYWFLTIDPDVTSISLDDAAQEIDTVLCHPRGWRSHDYNFEQVTEEEGQTMRRQKSQRKRVFHIRMSTPETIGRECKLHSLSCADTAKSVIYFNSNRWLYGSAESGLNLSDYRRYLIYHEIGHLLGRGHYKCSRNKNDLCPVMYQQTISKGCCKPNVWPLEWE